MKLEQLDLRFHKPVLAIVATAFVALTAVAIVRHGYLGIFAVALRDTASAQVFWDLVIAVSLLAGWMIRDAKARGATVWPYLIGVLFLGSIAPLAYLLLRPAPGSAPDLDAEPAAA